jgi:hypothetical protein
VTGARRTGCRGGSGRSSRYHLLGGALKDAGWARQAMSKNHLAILPDLIHHEIGAAPALGYTVLPFLNRERGRER